MNANLLVNQKRQSSLVVTPPCQSAKPERIFYEKQNVLHTCTNSLLNNTFCYVQQPSKNETTPRSLLKFKVHSTRQKFRRITERKLKMFYKLLTIKLAFLNFTKPNIMIEARSLASNGTFFCQRRSNRLIHKYIMWLRLPESCILDFGDFPFKVEWTKLENFMVGRPCSMKNRNERPSQYL